VDAVLEAFNADVGRLRLLAGELLALSPDLARDPALADPDRIPDVEALLNAARAAASGPADAPAPAVDRWYYTSVEKVVWGWVGLEDRLMEELG
jgi:hypothetical protein